MCVLGGMRHERHRFECRIVKSVRTSRRVRGASRRDRASHRFLSSGQPASGEIEPVARGSRRNPPRPVRWQDAGRVLSAKDGEAMKFTVNWTPNAQTKLLNLWLQASDRADITAAADRIEWA